MARQYKRYLSLFEKGFSNNPIARAQCLLAPSLFTKTLGDFVMYRTGFTLSELLKVMFKLRHRIKKDYLNKHFDLENLILFEKVQDDFKKGYNPFEVFQLKPLDPGNVSHLWGKEMSLSKKVVKKQVKKKTDCGKTLH